MALNALIKINGTEITEHGRTFSSALLFDNNDTELASGNMRRFYKPKKNSFDFSQITSISVKDISANFFPSFEAVSSKN